MIFDDNPIKNATKEVGSDSPINKSSALPSQKSLAFMESLTMPLVQEVVIYADMKCTECQKRISSAISRFNGTDSVLVDLLEKKVVVTCTHIEAPTTQITANRRKAFSKLAFIKRILRSSRSSRP